MSSEQFRPLSNTGSDRRIAEVETKLKKKSKDNIKYNQGLGFGGREDLKRDC